VGVVGAISALGRHAAQGMRFLPISHMERTSQGVFSGLGHLFVGVCARESWWEATVCRRRQLGTQARQIRPV
jgi:hypothetical protein